MRVFRMILAGLLLFPNIYSQKQIYFGKFNPPLDIPLYLSGNFGELRSSHFHSGLDFKTQGVTGKSVYSVNDGYVSRIKIQTLGYGNSIYITHPDGLTSVYGHLERFNDSIATYVKDYQYAKKNQTLDIYPDKELFQIKKGQLIAYSGNTGSSGGPHLHFELRSTSQQHPLNPLLYPFDIKDNISPVLDNLFIYPIGETPPGRYATPKKIPLKKIIGGFQLAYGDTLTLKGTIGFGLEASDLLNDISNECGVYSIELSVNDKVVYLFRIDELDFSESGYINAHCDYHYMVETNKKIHLLYRKVNNRLSLYPLIINNGLINFNPEEVYKLNIIVKDAYGNQSQLGFYVKGSAPAVMTPKQDSIPAKILKWNSPNYFENSQLSMSIPANSLYENCTFTYARTDVGYQKLYPFTHYLGDRFTPMQKPAEISISGESIPEQLRSKTVVAMVEDSNKISCLFTTLNGNRLIAQTTRFGKFTLVVDTVAPVITPLNIRPGADLKNQQSIRFQIRDELSGISEYYGFIDKSWVLFEYDPKNEIIVYTFDTERLKTGIEHEMELYIKDSVGNQKKYLSKFLY